MSNDFLIRDVQPGDFARWKPLWDGYNAFYGRKEETALPDAITTMTRSRFFDGYEPMHALVAEHSGSLLGGAFPFPSQHRLIWSLPAICKICSRATLQEVRESDALSSQRFIVLRLERNDCGGKILQDKPRTNQ